jgi:hypothetical protein
MPFRWYESYEFSEAGIATYAPGAPGIYGILNHQRLWICIDEAQNIETQLLAHLRGESVCSARIMQRQPAYFTFEKGVHRLALPTRRDELIREYRPLCDLIQPSRAVAVPRQNSIDAEMRRIRASRSELGATWDR